MAYNNSRRGQIKYITAYDPTIKRRVVFIVTPDGIATSLVTGYKFRYTG